MQIHFILESASRVIAALVVCLAASRCATFFETPHTPLADTAHRGDIERLRALVTSGADLNAYDDVGSTPLHWAARGGHPVGPHRCEGEGAARAAVVSTLLELGANPNLVDRRRAIPGGSSGWTPLHVALHHAQFATAAVLLAGGADPNILSREGTSVLVMASQEGAPGALLTTILDRGFDPQRAMRPASR